MFRTYEEIVEALPTVLRAKDVAGALGISTKLARKLFGEKGELSSITNTAFKLVGREQFLNWLDSLENGGKYDT